MRISVHKMIGRLGISLLLLAASQGCRRPLFVAGDEYHSAVLHTDWRAYRRTDPDGMTAWLFPLEEDAYSYRFTTAEVRHYAFYLPSGRYTGVVVDYSPEEYARQEFVGMEYASTAQVKSTASGYQPDSLKGLYGPGCYREPLPTLLEATGLYEVSNQPEPMAMDTLRTMKVDGGEYGYYIPYEVRDTYQSDLVVQDFYAYPVTPVWKFRIRLYVKGIDYMWDLEGSVAGLADGRFLALNKATDTPALLSVTGWESQRTGDNEGFVSVTFSTFGLQGRHRPHETYRSETGHEARTQMKPSAVIADWAGAELLRADDVRLNLRFLLRDRSTVLYYHYDVGERIVSYDDELVLRLDLGEDFAGHPDLPYVEPYNGTGFDADVRPWEDGGSADIPL